MTTFNAADISGVEAVKLVRQGHTLVCPVCKSTIRTVPENWHSGMVLHGLECPESQKHYLVHCDDAETMKEMRARMKALKDK